MGRQLKASGGFVLQVGENQFHIDPGPNALQRARDCGVNLRATTAVLASANTLFHANDINAVLDAMTYGGFDKKGVLIAAKSAVHGTEKQAPYLQRFYRECVERTIVMEAGKRVAVNEIEIQAMPTRNDDPTAIGFKFFTPYFTLVYSSDTKYAPEIAEAYKGSHILVLNVSSTRKDAANTLSTEEAVKLLQKVQPRLAVITHFGIDMVKSDPIYEAREIQKQTGIQTLAAKDGMVLNPMSYAVDKGQKTLHAFPRKDMPSEAVQEKADGSVADLQGFMPD